MKKILKVLSIVAVIFCVVNIISPVFAASGILDTIFGEGGKFFKDGINDTTSQNKADLFINGFTESGGIIDTIKTIGYLVFFITGALLGIRYMISGVEGKTFVKNGLIGYCLGAVFFYLADQVFTFFYDIFANNISSATSATTLSNTIWETFSSVVGVIIVAIVVVYGVKYMWASAEEQSKLKRGLVPLLIGAVLILCTLEILTFVVNIAEDTVGDDTTYDVSYINDINYEEEILAVTKM